MRKQRVLFIGGPSDGEWKEVELIPLYVVPVPEPPPNNFEKACKFEDLRVAPKKTVLYTLRRLCIAPGPDIYYYAPENMHDLAALYILFRNYKPTHDPTQIKS